MIELKLSLSDKGSAVRGLMREMPTAGTHPIFVGDDDTDEAEIRAALDLHGAGVRIGAPAPTAAIYGWANVDETLQWVESADLVPDPPQVPADLNKLSYCALPARAVRPRPGRTRGERR